jgi:galactose-1-phosphate uridylyltransferase
MYTSTKSQLLGATLPTETRTYKPVSHQQLMDLTLESIHQAGFTLDKEMYSSANEAQIANGKYTISNVADSEMQLQIGWQNSYDKSLSLKFAIGTRIMICQNGCVSGDYGAFKKKHMGEIQTFTPHAITEYIKQAGDAFRKMQEERETMKQIDLSKREAAELVGRLYLEDETHQKYTIKHNQKRAESSYT